MSNWGQSNGILSGQAELLVIFWERGSHFEHKVENANFIFSAHSNLHTECLPNTEQTLD